MKTVIFYKTNFRTGLSSMLSLNFKNVGYKILKNKFVSMFL